jgi:hypothetical protein
MWRLVLSLILVTTSSLSSADDRIPPNTHADKILVLKKERTLSLLKNGRFSKPTKSH